MSERKNKREKVNAQHREREEMLILLGICPRCRKNRIMGNERYCPECKAKQAEWKREHYEENKEKYREASRKAYYKRKEARKKAGLCLQCGKRKPQDGKNRCSVCLAKLRIEHEKYRRRKGEKSVAEHNEQAENGFCWFCGKPVKDGYKVCDVCYKRSVKNVTSENANKARQELIKQGILY